MQTGTYKEAVAGIKMAIIHKNHPDVKLDQTKSDIIQTKLLTAVDVNPSGEIPPQFLYSKFAREYFGSPVRMQLHKRLANANYQWTWGTLGGSGAECD